MSKKITYTPTKEFIDKIKPQRWGVVVEDGVALSKAQLIIYTMQEHGADEIRKVYRNIDFFLRDLYNELKNEALNRMCDNFEQDGHIELIDENKWFDDNSKDYILSQVSLKLSLLALVVKTSDYLEEAQKFSDKQGEIEEELDYFVESVDSLIKNEIKELLADYKTNEEEY